MKALILCAGKGTRLGSLTKNIPKPMVLINGKPVLEYLILLLKKHGVKEIAINTSHLSKKIKGYFGDGSKFGIKITYSYEEELLGTAGSLNNFKEFFDGPFFVIYGDIITNLDLTKMCQKHEESKAFGTIYLYNEKMVDKKTTIGKVLVDKAGFVKEIIENPNKDQIKEIQKIPEEFKFLNTGVYIFNPKILDFIPSGKSDFAKQILPKILENGLKIYGHTDKCYFKEIGQENRYFKAKEELESGEVKLNYIENE